MDRPRRVAIVPSLLTLCNGACGFAAIAIATRAQATDLPPGNAGQDPALGFLMIGSWLILAGAIFDTLDGWIARWTNASSRFGAVLDSLCDLITFGVAPALLLLKFGAAAGRMAFVAAIAYVAATALRLARSNAERAPHETGRQDFTGLPATAAAGCLAAVGLLCWDIARCERLLGTDWSGLTNALTAALPAVALVVAGLMVSGFKYPHLVNRGMRGRRSISRLAGRPLLVVVCMAATPGLCILLGFWGFAARGAIGQDRRSPAAKTPAAALALRAIRR